jgi:hypothetical protein
VYISALVQISNDIDINGLVGKWINSQQGMEHPSFI